MEETLDDLKRKLKNIASKISDKMNEQTELIWIRLLKFRKFMTVCFKIRRH